MTADGNIPMAGPGQVAARETKGALSYRPDIDGLRGVAVLLVVAFHAFPNLVPGGFIGVDVFFVISGFLISSLIFAALDAGTFTLADFWARRIRRIFPSLLLVLAACYGFGWVALLSDEYATLGKHIAGGAAFISNFVLLGEAGYFDGAAHLKPLLHLWSLGIEEQFYILWPLTIAAMWRWRAAFGWIVLGLALVSFGANVVHLGADPVGTFYLPWTRFWELLAGAGLAYVQLRRPGGAIPGIGNPSVANALSMAGAMAVVAGAALFDKKSAFPGSLALLPVLGAMAIIAVGPGAWFNRMVMSRRLLVWFGLISFPLYLWHWPLLSFTYVTGSPMLPREVRVLAVLAAIVLAWGTYRLVERPLRFGVHKRRNTICLLLGMFTMGVVGYITYRSDGVPARLPSAMQVVAGPGQHDCPAGYPAGSVCWGERAAAGSIVLLVGDSHGNALAPGLAQAIEAEMPEARLVSVAFGGCMPLAGVVSFDARGNRRECGTVFDEAFGLAKREPKVGAVVLVGRWASRVGAAVGFKEKEGDEARGSYRLARDPSAALDNSGAFRAALRDSLSRVPATTKVLFVHQVPELGLDPRRCTDRPLHLDYKSTPAECSVALAEVDRRQAEYRAIAAPVLALFPNVIAVDPVPGLCTLDRCSAVASGRLLYRDDDHLNGNGASDLGLEIVNVILRQGRPAETADATR